MSKLKRAVASFDNDLKKEDVELPGEMGAYIRGKRTIEVPDRPHYVYVRLRTNLSEIVQAYNDKLSPSFRLPVILKRDGNKYTVDRTDNNRYGNWENENKYVARHGSTHSFDLEGSRMGADPVWIFPSQFMPSLVSPFGVRGAQNAFIYPYSFVKDGSWKYSGNTGTPSLTDYNPASGTAVVLIGIDSESGNPALFASTGTYIPTTVTGTAELLPYVPLFDGTRYIPLSFAALQSGTFSVGWNTLHDIRQLAGSAGSTSTASIQHNSLGGLQGGVSGSYYHLSSVDYTGLVGGNNTTLHSHSGTASDAIFQMDGRLAISTGSALPYMITRPTTIDAWYIYAENVGQPSGTIIADVNLYRTGTSTSIFTNQANRPTLRYEDNDGWSSTIPGILNFQEGDILIPDIDTISSGSSGLVLVGKIAGVGASSTGLVVRDSSSTVSVSNTTQIIVPDGTLQNSGSGVATVDSKVIQVQHYQTGAVATTTTLIPLDDTIPQNTEGGEFMTLAITPKNSAHKLVIDVVIMISGSVVSWLIAALFQDSTANALAAVDQVIRGNTDGVTLSFKYVMVAGTTSATTFKVRAGMDRAGTATFNGSAGVRQFGGIMASTITITEITP